MIAHRGDIDGLRAIAALSIVIFHLDILGLVPGGFAGVDIFFVLSGYLITRTIGDDLRSGRFSVAEFYHRRVRRIFPALLVVFVSCIVGSMLLSFPSEAAESASSIVASVLFVSNILFYRTIGYFDRNAELNPLLHTWSLSVEEQFYVVFPLVMLALARRSPAARTRVLAALAFASFAYSCWILRRDPPAAFYLMPSRAWELLLGALIATGAVPNLRAGWRSEIVGAVGLALIVGSLALLSRSTPFPGAAALAPCLGTAALLHSGAGGTLASRVLGFGPLRFFGLISYSLYLWHWPVLVFYKQIDDPVRGEKAALLLAIVLLATLSYALVERPFRTRPYRLGPRGVLAAGAAAMAAVAATAAAIGPLTGLLRRYPEESERVLAYVRYSPLPHIRGDRCFLTPSSNDLSYFHQDECLALKADRRNVLVFGDSHAAHLWPGLATVYPRVNFLQATAALCKPLLPARGDQRCRDLISFIVDDFLPKHRVDAIVLSARWNAADLEEVKQTVALLKGLTDLILVFGPINEYEHSLPRILARQIDSNAHDLATQYSRADRAEADRAFAAGLAAGPAKYLSVQRLLCTPECIVWARRDTPLQFDYGHLTRDGSVYLASRLSPKLFGTVARSGRDP